MRMDEDMEEVLRDLPGSGPLYSVSATVRSGDRATEFKTTLRWLGIKGRLVATATATLGRNVQKTGGLSRTVCPGKSWA